MANEPMLDEPSYEEPSMLEDVDNKESSSMFSSIMSPFSKKEDIESPVSPVRLIEDVKNDTQVSPVIVPITPVIQDVSPDVPTVVPEATAVTVVTAVPVVAK